MANPFRQHRGASTVLHEMQSHGWRASVTQPEVLNARHVYFADGPITL
jgi:hypothetical protein